MVVIKIENVVFVVLMVYGSVVVVNFEVWGVLVYEEISDLFFGIFWCVIDFGGDKDDEKICMFCIGDKVFGI